MMNKLKKIINNRRIRREGGQPTSVLLREITKKNNVDVGLYTYGSCFSGDFNLGGEVKIGRYCSFGPNVRYFGGNHPMDYISMSPYFYQKTWAKKVSNVDVEDIPRSKLFIDNGCWIGANVIITANCTTIGEGAVVGAGAVVTKNVPPYSVVVGNPARIIKYRFDDKDIQLISDSHWWEYSPSELLLLYDDIDSVEGFCCRLKDIEKLDNKHE